MARGSKPEEAVGRCPRQLGAGAWSSGPGLDQARHRAEEAEGVEGGYPVDVVTGAQQVHGESLVDRPGGPP